MASLKPSTQLKAIIGRVRDWVLRDLGSERIGVGHAYEIGRIGDSDVRIRLLLQANQFDMTVLDLKDIIDRTLEIMRRRLTSPTHGSTPPPPSVGMI